MSGRCCVVTRVGGCHLMRNRRWTAAGEVMGGLVWQGVEGRRESVLSERFFLRRWQVRQGVPRSKHQTLSSPRSSASLFSHHHYHHHRDY